MVRVPPCGGSFAGLVRGALEPVGSGLRLRKGLKGMGDVSDAERFGWRK